MVLDGMCTAFQYMKLFRGNYHKTGESKGTNMIRTVHSVAYNRFAKKSKEIERSLKFIVLTNLSTFVRVFAKKLVLACIFYFLIFVVGNASTTNY